MKTVPMIRKKASVLEHKLRNKKVLYENFGDREMRALDDFTGDEYEYSQSERQEIQSIKDNLFNFCVNYEG